MKAINADSLIARYGIISDQVGKAELAVVITEAINSLRQPGDWVEMGCYTGTTSLYLQRVLVQMEDRRSLHVYDSFAGLPEKTAHDDSPAGMQFKAGELSAGKKEFILNFKRAHLPLPHIHKGWFSELTPQDMPSIISFAFLDGDYYESIKDSLSLIWPLLGDGATIVVDDYVNEALPGAQKAVDEWLLTHPAKLTVTQSLAVIRT